MTRGRSQLALVTVLALLVYQVHAAPVDFEKTGEEQVKEAVHKAEEAAKQAAEESISHGHKAETRVPEDKLETLASDLADSLKDDKAVKKFTQHIRKHPRTEEEEEYEKPVKEHRVTGKLSHLMGLSDMGDLSTGSNSYKEDTKLEDRLAMEAEEEKKYEDGYGGGDKGWDGGSEKGASWASNIQRQDAAEKQSIQAQVASESAHELDEIQNAITAESQGSRGSASIGEQGASVVQIGSNGMAKGIPEGAQFRQEGMNEAGATSEAPRIKSFDAHGGGGLQMPQTDIASIIRQSNKLSPSELQGPPKQYSSEIGAGLGGLGGSIGGGQSSQGLASYGQQEALGGASMEGGAQSMESSLGGERGGLSQSAYTGGASMEGGAVEGGSLGGGNIAGLGRGAAVGRVGENSMQGMNSLSGTSFGGGQQSILGGNSEGLQGMVGGGAGAMSSFGGGGVQTLGGAGGAGIQSLEGGAGGGIQSLRGSEGIQSYAGGSLGGMQTLGGQSLGGQSLGEQSLGRQSFGGQSLGEQSLGGMGGMSSYAGEAGGMMSSQMGYKKRSHTAKAESSGSHQGESKKSKLAHHRHHHHHHHHHHHKNSK